MNRHTRTCVLGIAAATATLFAFAATSPAATNDGELKFNNHCRTCHSVKKDDNRLGPSLHGIFGAKAGASEGYPSYSQGLKGSGIVWDEKTLDQFIANPDSVVPNNNMKPYKGVPDKGVRASIVEFLKAKSGGGSEPQDSSK